MSHVYVEDGAGPAFPGDVSRGPGTIIVRALCLLLSRRPVSISFVDYRTHHPPATSYPAEFRLLRVLVDSLTVFGGRVFERALEAVGDNPGAGPLWRRCVAFEEAQVLLRFSTMYVSKGMIVPRRYLLVRR